MLSLKFQVESVNSQLKMVKLKEDGSPKIGMAPTEVKTITLVMVTVDPAEWEYFELGNEYKVTIERIEKVA